MKLYKKIAWTAVLVPVVVALAVAFGTAPVGRRYVNEHGEELIGRRINIEDFTLNILTGNVSLGDVTVYEKNGSDVFASVKTIKLGVSVLDLIKGKLHIDKLSIKRPEVNVVQRNSTFNFDDLVASLSEGESSEYTIDKFVLSDGIVNYQDLSEPSVPFAYQMSRLKVKVKNFNTADLNHIELEARLGEDGYMEAVYDGKLDDQNNMGLTLKLEEVSLVDFSPLFVQMFGREVLSGELDLDTEITTVNGHVSGNNHVVITDPKVEKVKNLSFSPEYRRLPLKSALYVMTDKKGRCEMDLKVTGSKNDPKFSYKRALMKMFGKFLVKLVTSPFHHIDADAE